MSPAGMPPETRYARSGGVNIAYTVIGDAPLDLVFVSGWVSHLELAWEHPVLARFYRRLASFSRLIMFDKRGTGLSDRVSELPTLEQRMDDVRAVMDAVGVERAAVFGISEPIRGGRMHTEDESKVKMEYEMMANQYRPPVQPGEAAPGFTLATVPNEGFVSLADYRGKTPVLLAMMRGLYCAFCRRHIAQLSITRQKLQPLGVDVLAVVATKPERARLYYRLRPVGVPLAADPDLTIHRAYGVPNRALTLEIWQVIAAKDADLARELKIPSTDVAEVKSVLGRRDGFEPTESDEDDFQRQGAQFTGQVLIDREGIVRWVNIEAAKEGISGMEKFPTDEEFLAAARASLRPRPGERS